MKKFRQELQNLFTISFPVQPQAFISTESTSLSYRQCEVGKQKGIENKQWKAKEEDTSVSSTAETCSSFL